jgi:hypothetical protein
MYYDKNLEGRKNINSYPTDTKIVNSVVRFDVIIYLRNSYILHSMKF